MAPDPAQTTRTRNTPNPTLPVRSRLLCGCRPSSPTGRRPSPTRRLVPREPGTLQRDRRGGGVLGLSPGPGVLRSRAARKYPPRSSRSPHRAVSAHAHTAQRTGSGYEFDEWVRLAFCGLTAPSRLPVPGREAEVDPSRRAAHLGPGPGHGGQRGARRGAVDCRTATAVRRVELVPPASGTLTCCCRTPTRSACCSRSRS